MASFMSSSLRTSERYLLASIHTSCPTKAAAAPAAPSRTRLVRDLKPKPGSSGRLEVAPKSDNKKSHRKWPRSKEKEAKRPPPPPAFTRDSVPHAGVRPAPQGFGRTLRRSSKETLKDMPPISTPSSSLSLKHWAARAHAERTQRRVVELQGQKQSPQQPADVDPLGNEFDTSKLESTDELPDQFTSPPLLEGLLTSLHLTLYSDVKPTPIQALSLKHLFKPKASDDAWRQYLLASETGSGKSIAYLLPVLQDLKISDGKQRSRPSSPSPSLQKKPSMTPRALILAPTHELSRQLSSFAKSFVHMSKLRVLCASQANLPSASRTSTTASKMAKSSVDEMGESKDEVKDEGGGGGEKFELLMEVLRQPPKPVDVLVGTPNKVLEMARGRGWNWEERAKKKREQEALAQGRDFVDDKPMRSFWTDEPEMDLAGIEWVVVDEADILFDPDFQESTRMLLSDIASARGHSLPLEPNTALNPETPPTPIKYPFNLLLSTATIPSSLASYIDNNHPNMIRLASPNLHRLPRTLKTEYVDWTGGNRNSDIESRIKRVWAEDSLRGVNGNIGRLSKVLVFCNRRSKVEDLAAYLEERDIRNVALTGTAHSRKRGSNHHLDGFLKTKTKTSSSSYTPPFPLPVIPPRIIPTISTTTTTTNTAESNDPKKTPHVMITTSLLSRGLDFSADIKHVFIIDPPRNMIDFLHRAGRSGRAGEKGKVVIFGKMEGRGSALTKDVRTKVKALRA